MDAYAGTRHRVEIDVKGHLLVADPQAEQAANRTRVVRFADAQYRVAADALEQPVTLALVEFADVDGIAGLSDLSVFCQQAPHLQRAAGLLHMAFDQVIGVFGRADQAQAQG